ncbi:Derlin [Aphelenchoides besseyi]|nr:Derlin [Aphelenchoides besseyi]
MSDFSDWYNSIPQVTKYWFTAATVVPLIGRFGLLSPATMYLDWDLFFYRFQLWRPITSFIYYPLTPQTGFHWLLMIYFLYTYSKQIETSVFSGRPADYIFMLFFNWILCVLIGFAFGFYFLLEPMVLSVLYNWCQFNKDATVSFWFGTRFKAVYLPWVLVAFNMILRGGGMNEIAGILVGHAYYFLAVQYPAERGTAPLIKAPAFLQHFFPAVTGGIGGFGAPPRRPAERPPPNNAGNFIGRGHTLGGN